MGRKRKNITITEQEAPPKIEHEEEEEKAEAVPQLSAQEIEEHDRVDRELFDTMPPGYRFVPTGEELIASYLNNKLSDLNSLPVNRIRDVNIYDYHPKNLTSVYKLHRGKEWYFFTPRTKKYPNGQRPDRAAGNGFWKPTGADVPIYNDQGIKIGTKKTLVYYEGKDRENKGKKTGWTMHEYRQVDNTNNVRPVDKKDAKDMTLDECVLCKIYNKPYNGVEANDDQQDGNNTMIVPTNSDQLPNQNPNGDNFARQNVQLEPNPTTNQGRDGTSFYNRTSLFVPNQNITQGPDGGRFYNRVPMHRQNVQVPNPNITPRQDGMRFYNMDSNFPTQIVQVPNPNITQRRDGTCFYNMDSNLSRQNVQVPNPNITRGLDGVHFYNRASLPAQYVQVPNSNTNQFPCDGFDNMGSLAVQNDSLDVGNNFYNLVSLPVQNDSLDVGNNIYNLVSFPPSDYGHSQEALQNLHRIFPPKVINPDPFDDEPYDTHSQEALQGEEQTESMNYPPDYPAPVDYEDEVALDSKDGEVGKPEVPRKRRRGG